MRFDATRFKRLLRSYSLRLFILAMGWLVFITAFHFAINSDSEKRRVIHMGYMPVITNLAAPLLDYASQQNDGALRFKAIKFASFAEMAEALRNDDIQAAFIIAPLSIVLRQQGEDVKVVYIGNRHESTMVVRKALNIRSLKGLTGKTVAVPMRYSGHNLSLLKLIAEAGLENQIQVVEMNPPDMASALASGSLDAYFVGEPFAAQTLKSGDAARLFYVEEVWPNFICNLLLVKNQFIQDDPGSVKRLVEGAVRSGLWAQQNLDQAAKIASLYWGQPQELVAYALSTPKGRILFDGYVPRKDELRQMADLMVRFGLIQTADVDGLVEDQFARNVDQKGIKDLLTILGSP